ncbi:hypothetical protein [Chroococcus sp. FPU101]|uniref:hypothetical protein n=1 Tax=Chroococcus sp. FPU101 TaxID=1974212 RepID=UPI001A90BA96|nr:hypothetical protein [Chroococcus sp. FPU101]GFE69052.1 hypothetical protein CFPU101_16620 [Chroococcus sp. FPU101]
MKTKAQSKEMCCRVNAINKRLKTLAEVENALKVLVQRKKSITIANLSNLSGISKTWFYDEEELREIFRGRISEESIQKLFNYLKQQKIMSTWKI